MKIIHTAESTKGGIYTYIRSIVNLQSKRNDIEKIIIITSDIDFEDTKFSGNGNLSIIKTKKTKSRFLNSIYSSYTTYKYLKSENIDIVHIHSTYSGFFTRLLCVHFRKKIIYCPHGWAWERRSSISKMIPPIERFLTKFCFKIICISEQQREAAINKNIPSSKLVTIHNGIPEIDKPLLIREPSKTEKLKVLFVGRFDHQKGIDRLIKLLEVCKKEVFGKIVGDYVVDHPKREKKLTFPENSELYGWQNEDKIIELLNESDLLIMPSRWEGFGIVALEAMRSSRAVLAQNVGGLKEIVIDGETGYLCNFENLDEVSDLIKKTDRKEWLKLGSNGRERFLNEFTINKCEEKTFCLYKYLIASK